MSRDERIEKVQRLLTAHKTTREALESNPVTWELHPGTDIARNWPVITAAYSGLEQTLKYLIADRTGISIPELIDLVALPDAGIDQRHTGRHPYRTHNLAWLFSKLDDPARDVVRDFYGRFRSLHSYVAVADVDEFLNQVSGPRGAGYETLLDRFWSGRNGDTKVARAFVKQLHGKLGDAAAEPAWVFNVRGVRYRMPRPGEPDDP